MFTEEEILITLLKSELLYKQNKAFVTQEGAHGS